MTHWKVTVERVIPQQDASTQYGVRQEIFQIHLDEKPDIRRLFDALQPPQLEEVTLETPAMLGMPPLFGAYRPGGNANRAEPSKPPNDPSMPCSTGGDTSLVSPLHSKPMLVRDDD